MRHHLKLVAKHFQVDQTELENFALKNKKKYGIDDENGFITTSTTYTEDLIRDFKKEEYPAGSMFYSATGNLNNKKLVVTKIIRKKKFSKAME